jgi:hypothetical protein
MADVVVDAEVDDGRVVACAKIGNGQWEVNIRAAPQEFAALSSIGALSGQSVAQSR